MRIWNYLVISFKFITVKSRSISSTYRFQAILMVHILYRYLHMHYTFTLIQQVYTTIVKL